jgi:hypothetical protein
MAEALFGIVEFLAMTTLPQMLGAGLSKNSDIENEYNRQLYICQQIDKQKARTDVLNQLITEVGQAGLNTAAANDTLDTMRDDIQADINQINFMKKNFRTKILIFIIMNIVTVSIIALLLAT